MSRYCAGRICPTFESGNWNVVHSARRWVGIASSSIRISRTHSRLRSLSWMVQSGLRCSVPQQHFDLHQLRSSEFRCQSSSWIGSQCTRCWTNSSQLNLVNVESRSLYPFSFGLELVIAIRLRKSMSETGHSGLSKTSIKNGLEHGICASAGHKTVCAGTDGRRSRWDSGWSYRCGRRTRLHFSL